MPKEEFEKLEKDVDKTEDDSAAKFKPMDDEERKELEELRKQKAIQEKKAKMLEVVGGQEGLDRAYELVSKSGDSEFIDEFNAKIAKADTQEEALRDLAAYSRALGKVQAKAPAPEEQDAGMFDALPKYGSSDATPTKAPEKDEEMKLTVRRGVDVTGIKSQELKDAVKEMNKEVANILRTTPGGLDDLPGVIVKAAQNHIVPIIEIEEKMKNWEAGSEAINLFGAIYQEMEQRSLDQEVPDKTLHNLSSSSIKNVYAVNKIREERGSGRATPISYQEAFYK